MKGNKWILSPVYHAWKVSSYFYNVNIPVLNIILTTLHSLIHIIFINYKHQTHSLYFFLIQRKDKTKGEHKFMIFTSLINMNTNNSWHLTLSSFQDLPFRDALRDCALDHCERKNNRATSPLHVYTLILSPNPLILTIQNVIFIIKKAHLQELAHFHIQGIYFLSKASLKHLYKHLKTTAKWYGITLLLEIQTAQAWMQFQSRNAVCGWCCRNLMIMMDFISQREIDIIGREIKISFHSHTVLYFKYNILYFKDAALY